MRFMTGALVYFKAAPYWLDEPQNLILAPGEDGRLVCRANGNPKPVIQWLVNGEPIEGGQGRLCTSLTKILAKDLMADQERQVAVGVPGTTLGVVRGLRHHRTSTTCLPETRPVGPCLCRLGRSCLALSGLRRKDV